MVPEVPVIEIPQVLTPEECAREIERASRQGFVEQTFRGEERPEVRNRATIDDSDTAAWLWTRVSNALPPLANLYRDGLRPAPDVASLEALVPVGLNQRLRYYKYLPGQRFDRHVDLSHSEGPLRSFLTLIVYLNEGFHGGETDFFGRSVSPKQGAAIAFPHELGHEGRPVLAGVKHVVRTDVMYR
jgi:prolyl 4-hydroxylase